MTRVADRSCAGAGGGDGDLFVSESNTRRDCNNNINTYLIRGTSTGACGRCSTASRLDNDEDDEDDGLDVDIGLGCSEGASL